MSHEGKDNLATYSLNFKDDNQSIQIKIPILTNNIESEQPHVILFTGFGEQRPQALSASLKPFTSQGFKASAIGLPFDKISLKAADWLLDEGLSTLIQELNVKNDKIILSGVSRGAAVAASVFGKKDDLYEGLLLISPLGLVRLSPTKYIFRTVIDSMDVRYYGKETFRNTRDIAREAINHGKSKDGLKKALHFAMGQQDRVAQGIRSAHKKNKVLAIFSGSHDKVFKVNETNLVLMKLLDDDSIEHIFHPVAGNHAPVASKIGQSQLGAAASWLKSKY